MWIAVELTKSYFVLIKNKFWVASSLKKFCAPFFRISFKNVRFSSFQRELGFQSPRRVCVSRGVAREIPRTVHFFATSRLFRRKNSCDELFWVDWVWKQWCQQLPEPVLPLPRYPERDSRRCRLRGSVSWLLQRSLCAEDQIDTFWMLQKPVSAQIAESFELGPLIHAKHRWRWWNISCGDVRERIKAKNNV